MSAEREQIPSYPFPAPAPLEPPRELEELRQGCPFAPVRLPSGDQAVLLTRYEDVKQVLLDPRFTRDLSAEGAARITSNEKGGVFEDAEAAAIASGEAHQLWRRWLLKWFMAKEVSAMQGRIEAMAEHLVQEMKAKGSPADLTSALAFPLPVWVICDVLGVPDVDRTKLAHWSNTMLTLTQHTQPEIDAAQAEFTAYLEEHVAKVRQKPGDDLISELASDPNVPDFVLIMTAKGLLVAGHETTSNMIGKMMAMLLSDRRRWEQLLADPSLVRTAVEEALRFDANMGFGLPRFITEELQVGGATLPKNTTVICNLSAANRDEKAFERSGEMDLARSPNPHVTFGLGPHSCVGQSLARTELQTVLSVLLRRLPTLELAEPAESLQCRKGLLVGGLERVPVKW